MDFHASEIKKSILRDVIPITANFNKNVKTDNV
jgi:hypothetical protein